jgi:hypothetical protein
MPHGEVTNVDMAMLPCRVVVVSKSLGRITVHLDENADEES